MTLHYNITTLHYDACTWSRNDAVYNILVDVKNTFFNIFILWNVFYFIVAKFLILLNLLESY